MPENETEPQADANQWHTEEWVCTGFDLTNKDKIGVKFQVITEDSVHGLGRQYFFEKKKHIPTTVGAVYQVEVNGDSVRLGAAKWQRTFGDKAKVAEWQMAARAFKLEQQARKLMADETKRDYSLELLAPIKLAYARTNAVGRLAIEVQLLAYLRGYNN